MAKSNTKPKTQDTTDVPGKVLVKAHERGYDSEENRLVEPGDSFYISTELARKGASWFDVVGDLPAEEPVEEAIA